ncbi:apolipoprotein N-acyltransferase [bacterium]|nr:apolipoprotein N-acyltransferase [bacterium]
MLWAAPLVYPALWALAFVAFLPAAWAARGWPAKRLAAGALLAGAAVALPATAWILTFGILPWLLLAVITGGQLAVAAWLLALVRDRLAAGDPRRDLLFPAAVFLFELARAYGPWGWTWTHPAHWLAGAPHQLLALGAWVGANGMALLLAALAAGVARMIAGGRRRSALAVLALLVALLVAGFQPPATKGFIRVRAVASGLSTREAWDLATFDAVERLYMEGSEGGSPQAVLWPESALVASYPDPAAAEAAAAAGVPVLYGAYVLRPGFHHNVYGVVFPDGTHADPYRKRQLVPMGERVYMRPLITKILPGFPWPAEDVYPGPGDPPLSVADTLVGPLLCWESLFPALARDHARAGAEWIVVAANTSWFTPQATRMVARFQRWRAVETGMGLISVVTGGGTSVVDARGRLTEIAAVGEDVALDVAVELGAGATFYTRWGDLPLLAVSLLLVAGCLWPAKRG